ncbi:MAG: tetratricopeptide repeat protein [Pseudomonadota bacterium]
MKKMFVYAAILALLTSGCSSWFSERVATLADLPVAEHEPPITPEPLPSVGWEEVAKSYERLRAETTNPQLHAKALKRLADLTVEGYGKDETAPVSDEEFQRAVKQYDALLADADAELERDFILYQKARAYDQMARPELALKPLTELVTQYPNSPLYGEAQYRRGEILFSLQNYREAQNAYRAAAGLWSDSPYYRRALYKYGWSMFKQGNYQDALLPFFALFDWYQVLPPEKLDPADLALIEDSHRVVSLSFSSMNGVASVKEFLSRRAQPPYTAKIYENLAEFYVKQELHEEATKTLKAFVAQYPQAPESAGFMLRVVDIYQNRGFATQALQAKVDFATQFGARQPYWKTEAARNWESIKPRLQITVTDLASFYHAKAQRSGARGDYDQAVRWYDEYIQSFPQDAQTPGLHFLMAEALAESGQMAESIVAYETTSYGYPAHEKSAEAGYAAFLNYQQLLAQTTDEAQDEYKRGSILSGRRFVGYYPQDPRVVTVQARVADLLFELREDAEAVATARELLEGGYQLTPEMQRSAWTIIAHGEFALAEYPSSEHACQQALRFWPAESEEFAALIERQAAAIYRQGEIARDAGEFAAAADHFLRVGKQTPQANIRVTADYDAAMALVSATQWERAIAALNDFLTRYPQHELYASAEEQLAQAYASSEQWSKVAQVYERMQARETDPERRSQLQWNAADLYLKGGEAGMAIAAYSRYVEQFPEPLEQAIEARQKLADLYAQQGKPGARREWLRSLIDAHHAGAGTDRTTYLAAKAELELAQADEAEFRAVKLAQPLKENLAKKKDLMQKTVAAYGRAVEYKVGEVTSASVYRLAEVYRHFAAELLGSERPAEIDAEEAEMYNVMLEEQAFPFEEKALSIHESNMRLIPQGVYDQWVKASMRALAELNPGRYAKQELIEYYVNTLF